VNKCICKNFYLAPKNETVTACCNASQTDVPSPDAQSMYNCPPDDEAGSMFYI